MARINNPLRDDPSHDELVSLGSWAKNAKLQILSQAKDPEPQILNERLQMLSWRLEATVVPERKIPGENSQGDPKRTFSSETSEGEYIKRKNSGGNFQTKDPKLNYSSDCFDVRDLKRTSPSEIPKRKTANEVS